MTEPKPWEPGQVMQPFEHAIMDGQMIIEVGSPAWELIYQCVKIKQAKLSIQQRAFGVAVKAGEGMWSPTVSTKATL